jgi:hypothetical protein
MLDTVVHRADFDSTVANPETHGTTEVAAHRFSYQRHSMRVQRLSCGHQVAFPHLDGSGGREGGKHAGPTGQAAGDALSLCPVGNHQLQQAGNR